MSKTSDAISMYERGIPLKQILKDAGITKSCLYSGLKNKGIKPSRIIVLFNDEVERTINSLAEKGYSENQAAGLLMANYNVSYLTARKWLIRLGY